MKDYALHNLSCKVDWLSFTYKHDSSFATDEYDYFLKAFPELEGAFQDGIEIKLVRNSEQRFYNQIISFNDFFSVGFRDEPMNGKMKDVNMGVNVSIPSHGLEYFLKLFALGPDGIAELLRIITSRGCSVSRLDLAYDDYRKTFLPSDLCKFWNNDQIVSTFSSGRYYFSKQKGSDSFYLGSRSNGKLLRVYDKAAESNGDIDAIRWEFELHRDYADSYVNYIIHNNCAPDFRDILSQFINRVVAKENYSNKRMLPAAEFWLEFIDSAYLSFCEQLEVSTFKDQKDALKSLVDYINNQVLPSLASYGAIFGYDTLLNQVKDSKLHSKDLLLRGLYKLKPKEYQEYLEGIDHYFAIPG